MDLSKCFPCPRCETADGLHVKIAVPKQPGMTYAIACKCGVCTEPRATMTEALELWEMGASIADMLIWDSYASQEIIDEYLSTPFGRETEEV